jgi:hypothetical protein
LRAQAAIKTEREWIRRNQLWKQKIMSWELNMSIQSMSCLIRDDQHERAPLLKRTHPYSCFEGMPILGVQLKETLC